MWQRFTDHAKRVVFLAQEEAAKLGDNYVSTEHMLLGIVRERNSGASQALRLMGVDPAKLKETLDHRVEKKGPLHTGDMQLAPRAKRSVDLAYEEARRINQGRVCSEHLLMGLVKEHDGLAAQVLAEFGIDAEKTRNAIIRVSKAATLLDQKTPSAGIKSLKGEDLLDIASLNIEQIEAIFALTDKLKNMPADQQRKILEGKTLAMIFEKPSLRTRVSFETGIFQLGGHGIYLSPNDIGLGKRESIADVARTLDRMCDIIMARVYEHYKVTDLGKYANVPVINGLSDLEHPCQALADFQTIREKKGNLKGLKMAFIGDGNNVAHSLMFLAAKVGTHFSLGCPEGYEPDAGVVAQAKEFASKTGAQIEILNDPCKAVEGADVVYTDVWASMGQEAEAEARAKVFAPFQVNVELMNHAKEDAVFEHCLPAHRGAEVTDDVIDGRWSVVFDEAENRLHAQKAVMVLLGG